jgi:hypothetical protein
LQHLGGNNIHISAVENLIYSLELVEGVNFLLYESAKLEYPGTEEVLQRNRQGLIPITLRKLNGSTLTLPLLPIAEEDEYILMYLDKFNSDLKVTIQADGPGMEWFNYNPNVPAPSNKIILNQGINILKLPRTAGLKELDISHNLTLSESDADSVYVGVITLAEGYNPALGGVNTELLNEISRLATVDGINRYYYLHTPGNEERMDVTNISSPAAF